MIFIQLNKEVYVNDIHSIVGAFYAGEKIKIEHPNHKVDDMNEQDITLQMSLIFEDHSIYLNMNQEEFILKIGTLLKDFSEKDEFKAFFYDSLSKVTKKALPWGNLTGIRPTKLAMKMLEESQSVVEIEDFLRKKHRVSKEKIALSIEIAKRERSILEKLHLKEGYSLYIGIPFCPTTCLYCSFTSYPIHSFQEYTEQYIDALIEEMDVVKECMEGKILDTVYIGGGTPTTLNATQLERLVQALKDRFDFSTVVEFTVEAGRPDSISKEKLQVLSDLGVDRISINPQTMNEETLKIIGRKHTVEEVKDRFFMAREMGFSHINMDLILGLPKEGDAQVRHTLEEIKKLDPDSITLHSLAIKRASKLGRWMEENKIKQFHNSNATMELTHDLARKLEMKPYYLYRQKNIAGNFENIGYAKEGKYGIYNILIMEEKQTIVALGAGSISKVVNKHGEIKRSDNVKDVKLYIEKIEEMKNRKRELLQEIMDK